MKKLNINWEPVGKFAKSACEILVYGALAVMSIKFSESTAKRHGKIVNATYSGAVEAIMNSDMYSHYKSYAITMLKRDGDAEYYGAIIRIVEDDNTYSHYKLDMIKALSKE